MKNSLIISLSALIFFIELLKIVTITKTDCFVISQVNRILLLSLIAQYAKKSNYSLSNKGKVAISLVSVLVLFLVFSLVVWLIRRKRKGKQISFHFFGSQFIIIFHLICSALTSHTPISFPFSALGFS